MRFRDEETRVGKSDLVGWSEGQDVPDNGYCFSIEVFEGWTLSLSISVSFCLSFSLMLPQFSLLHFVISSRMIKVDYHYWYALKVKREIRIFINCSLVTGDANWSKSRSRFYPPGIFITRIMLDSLVRSCVACDANTDDILRLFFIDTCVCLTFNKIRPTRVHKHRWVATDRVDHHHHACLFSRFVARVRFHRDTSGSDKFFSLTTLTFDATGEKFLTLASDIFFFFASRLSSYHSRCNCRKRESNFTLLDAVRRANYFLNTTTSYRVIKWKRTIAPFSIGDRSVLMINMTWPCLYKKKNW